MLFEVQTQVRLPGNAGKGGHHPRRSDGAALFGAGSIVDGDAISPSVLERLVESKTLAETTETRAAARRAEDAERLRAAAEAERAKAEAAKAEAAKKGGRK